LAFIPWTPFPSKIGGSLFSNSDVIFAHIPNSVVNIGSEAFSQCDMLTGVNVPSSVNVIGSKAFNNCSNITLDTLPYGITSIISNILVDISNECELPTHAKGDGLGFIGHRLT